MAEGPDRWIRSAVFLALGGLFFLGVFLVKGFTPWTTWVGIFLGVPLLFLGIALYLVAVFRDLRRRGIL